MDHAMLSSATFLRLPPGEYLMMDVSTLDLYVRQVPCDEPSSYCITGIWARVSGHVFSIRAPAGNDADALVEIDSVRQKLEGSRNLATNIFLDYTRPNTYVIHHYGHYDVFIYVRGYFLEIMGLVNTYRCRYFGDTGKTQSRRKREGVTDLV